MTIELKVPDVGESVHEVQIGQWLKQEGDFVEQDETVVELDTDKASLELPAPSKGTLSEILRHEGDVVSIGDVIARIDEKAAKTNQASNKESVPEESVQQDSGTRTAETTEAEDVDLRSPKVDRYEDDTGHRDLPENRIPATPSARRALREHGLTAEEVKPSGKRVRIEDVESYLSVHKRDSADEHMDREQPRQRTPEISELERDLEEVVPMSLIRRRISERLVEAQKNSALVTTFNEINMSAVQSLKKEHQEHFQARHEVKLGIMSFFVKAVIDGLMQYPSLNAELRDDKQIVYRNYYHIGIAVEGERGLVVPVLRFAERLSFAEIEQAIDDFVDRALSRKLKPQELTGGTFTVSNGGIYGSLFSTPITNPPQSGVLGMHAIQERPVAHQGQVIVRPMMYVALTYDHRLVDGREAVSFLQRVREAVEDPARMLIES